MLPLHRHNLRVYYDDTDSAGVVYHANYLKFAERGRTEMLRALGLDQRSLRDEDGVVFAVRRCHVEYLLPAALDDALEVESQVTEVTGATLEVAQSVRRDGRELARLAVTLVCLTHQGRATRWPARLRALVDGKSGARVPHEAEARR